jgi:hypothetical protein
MSDQDLEMLGNADTLHDFGKHENDKRCKLYLPDFQKVVDFNLSMLISSQYLRHSIAPSQIQKNHGYDYEEKIAYKFQQEHPGLVDVHVKDDGNFSQFTLHNKIGVIFDFAQSGGFRSSLYANPLDADSGLFNLRTISSDWDEAIKPRKFRIDTTVFLPSTNGKHEVQIQPMNIFWGWNEYNGDKVLKNTARNYIRIGTQQFDQSIIRAGFIQLTVGRNLCPMISDIVNANISNAWNKEKIKFLFSRYIVKSDFSEDDNQQSQIANGKVGIVRGNIATMLADAALSYYQVGNTYLSNQELVNFIFCLKRSLDAGQETMANVIQTGLSEKYELGKTEFHTVEYTHKKKKDVSQLELQQCVLVSSDRLCFLRAKLRNTKAIMPKHSQLYLNFSKPNPMSTSDLIEYYKDLHSKVSSLIPTSAYAYDIESDTQLPEDREEQEIAPLLASKINEVFESFKDLQQLCIPVNIQYETIMQTLDKRIELLKSLETQSPEAQTMLALEYSKFIGDCMHYENVMKDADPYKSKKDRMIIEIDTEIKEVNDAFKSDLGMLISTQADLNSLAEKFKIENKRSPPTLTLEIVENIRTSGLLPSKKISNYLRFVFESLDINDNMNVVDRIQKLEKNKYDILNQKNPPKSMQALLHWDIPFDLNTWRVAYALGVDIDCLFGFFRKNIWSNYVGGNNIYKTILSLFGKYKSLTKPNSRKSASAITLGQVVEDLCGILDFVAIKILESTNKIKKRIECLKGVDHTQHGGLKRKLSEHPNHSALKRKRSNGATGMLNSDTYGFNSETDEYHCGIDENEYGIFERICIAKGTDLIGIGADNYVESKINIDIWNTYQIIQIDSGPQVERYYYDDAILLQSHANQLRKLWHNINISKNDVETLKGELDDELATIEFDIETELAGIYENSRAFENELNYDNALFEYKVICTLYDQLYSMNTIVGSGMGSRKLRGLHVNNGHLYKNSRMKRQLFQRFLSKFDM